MRLEDFTYDLPDAKIALYPPEIRGSSRLLGLDRVSGQLTDGLYAHVVDFLQAGDVLVLNNTKVIPARLRVRTDSGSERELLLLELHASTNDPHRARIMYRHKLRIGQKLHIGETYVTVSSLNGDGTGEISSDANIYELADKYGQVPLPPYLHREAEGSDVERYQTVFAEQSGSVAAPTASLNLTEAILDSIRQKGVTIVELTLHVGLGTFMPIRTDNLTEHRMHQEYFEIPFATCKAIRQAKQAGCRVVAVGTTVTRTLEYAFDAIQHATSDVHGEADIFIYPGYAFKAVDAMLTNFHAPKSTVLMMAAAFAGWENLRTAYEYAIAHDYNFLSYGDSMFIY